MNLFDIIGPVMVGPSSSHTAGAARLGYVAQRLLGEPVARAGIGLYGSFLATGKGHGTKKALVAGLLGMLPDDERIPESFAIAADKGLAFSFEEAFLNEAHPNTAVFKLMGKYGRRLEMTGISIGGSRIRVTRIDGVSTDFTGDYPTLIVNNADKPGLVAGVAALLADHAINIASMQLYRSSRGKDAIMVMECDQEIPGDVIKHLREQRGIMKVMYLSLERTPTKEEAPHGI